MVERRMESKLDPGTGTYREVPAEKWDWVEIPCADQGPGVPRPASTFPAARIHFFFSSRVAVIPGTYVYVVPDINTEILFYHGYWYRPSAGRWYWARTYNGPWLTLPPPESLRSY